MPFLEQREGLLLVPPVCDAPPVIPDTFPPANGSAAVSPMGEGAAPKDRSRSGKVARRDALRR